MCLLKRDTERLPVVSGGGKRGDCGGAITAGSLDDAVDRGRDVGGQRNGRRETCQHPLRKLESPGRNGHPNGLGQALGLARQIMRSREVQPFLDETSCTIGVACLEPGVGGFSTPEQLLMGATRAIQTGRTSGGDRVVTAAPVRAAA